MEMSEHYDSQIAQEEHLYQPAYPKQLHQRIKIATVAEIKAIERMVQIKNAKFQRDNLLLFKVDSSEDKETHFVYEGSNQWFENGQEKIATTQAVEYSNKSFNLTIPISNIIRENRLKLDLSSLKRGKVMILENMEKEKAIRFKYTFQLSQNSLVLKALVEIDGQFKLWKDVQIPLTENRVTIDIKEYNNEHTDVKVNDYLFHLIMKMPYCQQSYYRITIDGAATIDRLDFWSKSLHSSIEKHELLCSNECQLI